MKNTILSGLLFALLSGAALAQITPGVTYTGDATTYTLSGVGAGGLDASEVSDYYAALNDPQWDGSAWCGAWVEITGPSGTSTVQIVDLCPGCPSGHLDLGPIPFMEVTGDSSGIYPISWRLVSRPGSPGPIHFYSAAGSNGYYLKLQAANIVNPVASMEIFHEGSYVAMALQSDNHYLITPGIPIVDPFTIRVTDIYSNQVVSTNLTFSGTANGQDGGGNFPAVVEDDITVEQPLGNAVADGGTVDFGFSIDGSSNSLEFTIRNLGSSTLTGISVSNDGPHAADFNITSSPSGSIATNGTTTFTVAFSSSATGSRTAAVHVASSTAVPALASYDITLTGISVSTTNDTDSDGLNDGAEASLASMGFDWQVSQPALVDAYYDNATLAGLYTAAQIQALNIDAPLLQTNPGTGTFTLTLSIGKSIDLTNFFPFPFTEPNLSVTPSGTLEFEFTSTNDAAFFRLEGN